MIEQMKEILVAVDGSKSASKALSMAVLLAKSSHAVLDILYVTTCDSDTDTKSPSWLPKSVTKPTGPELHAVLKKAEDQVGGAVPVHICHATGVPTTEILRFADEHKVDAIVIGGRGLGRVEGFFLGSVSQEIMQKAERTVIVVK